MINIHDLHKYEVSLITTVQIADEEDDITNITRPLHGYKICLVYSHSNCLSETKYGG